jgi:soluble cytochrome b562
MNLCARRLISAFGLTAALVLPNALRAAEQAQGDDSPLHTAMEEMGRGMRTVNRALTGADPAAAKADVLAALHRMQELAITGKVLVPASIEKLPEAERPAKLAAFRADLAAAIGIMLEIERAVLADNWDLAKETFGKLRTARKDGHDKYNPEEEKP